MEIVIKSRKGAVTFYTVEWDGIIVDARVEDGRVTDSSFKHGSDSFLKLSEFVLADYFNTL